MVIDRKNTSQSWQTNMQQRLIKRNADELEARTLTRVIGRNIYIQAEEPSSPQVGDLWFDLSFLEE